MVRGQKKVTYILLVTSILLQVFISFSVLYVSYTRSSTCNNIKTAYEKACIILSSSEDSGIPSKKLNKFTQPTFVAEVAAQVASTVGVTVVTFFYKEGRLAVPGYATLMVFFFILGSFSSFPSVVDRRESLFYATKLNSVLDNVLASQSSVTETLSTMTDRGEIALRHATNKRTPGEWIIKQTYTR
ncbi:hypothetical protein NSE_0672 [Neorickettsia sennetsu str. Miyayama]|uniref:Uncharacterized protein n=2 Tax=Ehrlichia sennetsu TaxID=951 RepID=Q2GD96_EHRS3|nr:hypothetical protein NSE_0672 [Neorickettsia sennetsu str. Miyayama]